MTLGGFPVPGAIVTATQNGKSVVAVSDTQGLYSFPDLADGTWTVQVEMTGFAPLKDDVAIAPNAPAGKWELKVLSLDQIRAAAKPIKVEAAPAMVAGVMPATPKPAATTGKANAKADAKGAPTTEAAAPAEEASHAPDALLINGSVNNAATSQFALAPAFGNTRSSRSLYTGGFTLYLANSSLNAKPFSLAGQNVVKPVYTDVTAGFALQGPIRIPHLLPRGPNFYIGYQWTRDSNDQTLSGLVPTADQRNGIGVLPAGTSPVSQATALLAFYPLPNVAGSTQYNYQTPSIRDTHQDAANLRLDKSIGQRNQFNGGFSFQSARGSGPNLFGFVDTTDSLGINTNVNWSHRFKQRLFMNNGFRFSRSRNQSLPYFANRVNVSNAAGINGNLQDANDWGPPGLSFSTGISGLSDANSSYNRNETNALSSTLTWNRTRHNIQFGGDFRRLEFNNLSQQNPRGSFQFTGQASGISDFADFLQGTPDTSTIAYGNADKYFRESTYDAFVLDDWRVRPELTINAGIRWEYGAPITELKGRLVNLDAAPGFTAVAPVLANKPVGPLSGQSFNTSLVHPDKSGFSPQIGISWRPISGSSVLVKAGYGISNDTSVYQTSAQNMAQQAPLSTSLNVVNSAACPLTLANGFLPCTTTTADTFAIDPRFRVGYAQTWQLSMQRDLPAAMQMTATYQGIKGTRGVQQFLPNTYPTGFANPCPSCPSGYVYQTSNGNSTREAGNIQLRRRLRAGFTATLQYTYSKSIDDDSFLGGQGRLSAGSTSATAGPAGNAQNWLNLRGERGLSSFDQRHLLNVNLQYTTGMGLGGRALMSGWRGLAYKEWTVVTTITAGTGLPQTPNIFEALQGSTCTSCIRPDFTGQPLYVASGGRFLNADAFQAPPSGQFGNVRRNSITGPSQFSLNASMQRGFRLHDRYNLQARFDATNVLNHVTYTGWNTSLVSLTNPALTPAQANPLFGTPLNANTMRQITATMSLRF